MHKHHIGITSPAGIERLPGALGDHTHLNTGLLGKQGKNMVKQTGILRRGGRRNSHKTLLGLYGLASNQTKCSQ